MIEYTTEPAETNVLVGTGYGHERAALRDNFVGPDGTRSWESVHIGRRDFPVQRMPYMLQDGIIHVHNDIRIPVYQGNQTHFELLEATFQEMPPSHLEWLLQIKPLGIILNERAGLGGSARYTGGVNPGVDYPETPALDDRMAIIITYGALWNFREQGFSPTLIHEIGHVMTHGGKISYGGFNSDIRSRLVGESTSGGHSRSGSSLEALCDVYMYLICYGSTMGTMRSYSTRRGELAASRDARNGLRASVAFTTMLDAVWRVRYTER